MPVASAQRRALTSAPVSELPATSSPPWTSAVAERAPHLTPDDLLPRTEERLHPVRERQTLVGDLDEDGADDRGEAPPSSRAPAARLAGRLRPRLSRGGSGVAARRG
jgi:hypothetical protein